MFAMDRRKLLQSMGAALALGAAGAVGVRGLDGPASAIPPAGCPISWKPSALAPVFYSYRHYFYPHGAPTPMQVYFPSLDGAAANAQPLEGCGRYPLIVLVRGLCFDPEHYRKWTRLPAALARSGYVVAVPNLSGIGNPADDQESTVALALAIDWMRSEWKYRHLLQPPPATGLIGHSFGALHAGHYATSAPVSAVASLSGVWNRWDNDFAPNPLLVGDVPKLLTWGTGGADGEADAVLPSQLWDAIAALKHRAVFGGAVHWDYLPGNASLPCRTTTGSCALVGAAAADLVTLFFARYLPPEGVVGLPGKVRPELVPPPALSLTWEQEQYAGGHLTGWQQYQDQSCADVQVSQKLPSVLVPDVRGESLVSAKFTLEAAGLAVKVVIPGGPGQPGMFEVVSQSPAPGTSVAPGTTVTLIVRTVEIEL